MPSSRQRLAQAETASERMQRPRAAASGCGGELGSTKVCESPAEAIMKSFVMTTRERKTKAQETETYSFLNRELFYGFLLDGPQELGVKEKS